MRILDILVFREHSSETSFHSVSAPFRDSNSDYLSLGSKSLFVDFKKHAFEAGGSEPSSDWPCGLRLTVQGDKC